MNDAISYSSDRPLDDPTMDALGYASFAQSVASSIERLFPGESMVISLNGPWGCGKTTILHFIAHYLRQGRLSNDLLLANFNPWWFSSREDLARLLISQIRAQLGRKEHARLKEGLSVFMDALSGISLYGVSVNPDAISKRLRKVPNLGDQKATLDQLLSRAGKFLVVMIDDIDRLAPEEMCDLFRTVKAVASFTNVVYVLAFDLDAAIKAIKPTFADGYAYLEKIIQLPFKIPLPDKIGLRSMLFAKLDAILSHTGKANFDLHDWQNLYFSSIDHFIRTPRSITILSNSLLATYPPVCEEVNCVDFIGIESLRVFLPELYSKVRDNDVLMTGRTESNVGRSENTKKAEIDSWLSAVAEEDRPYAHQLLLRMFPVFRAIYTNIYISGSPWRRQKRVCSPEVFPIYFRFGIDPDSIPSRDIMRIIDLASDKIAFIEELRNYSRTLRRDGISKLRYLFERLEDYTSDYIPLENIPIIVEAFFDAGDEFLLKSDESRGFYDFGNEMRMGRLVYQLLRRLKEDDRFEIILKAISAGSALGTICREFVVWNQEHGLFEEHNPPPENERTLTKEHLDDIGRLLLPKIRNFAERGLLLQSRRLSTILSAWKSLNDAEQKLWVEQVVSTDEALVEFVEKFGGIFHTAMGDDVVSRQGYGISPEALRPYVDLSVIATRLRNLSPTLKLSDIQTFTVQQFLRGYRPDVVPPSGND